ncbi:protein-tyrosine phosphatase [Phlyctochytrium arcticum]|nr:protein-tyrosine phosphatase [Phlyctochytrium arcticum]
MATILTPPDAFGMVEKGIYRSSPLHPTNFTFIRTLGLRTVVILTHDIQSKAVSVFYDECGTRVIQLGGSNYPNIGWRPVSEELVKDCLELVLNVQNHPIMVMCNSGINDTGTLIGCLRKLQGWNFNSIIVEYRSYAGSKSRYVNEQFIELFDMDLITLPQHLPSWFIYQQKLLV